MAKKNFYKLRPKKRGNGCGGTRAAHGGGLSTKQKLTNVPEFFFPFFHGGSPSFFWRCVVERQI